MECREYEVLVEVEDSHWWHGGMRATAAAMLHTFYAHRCDLHILDTGCGTGGNMRFLQRYGTVIGIDLSAKAIELAVPRVSGQLIRGSVMQLPFPNEAFDLVTSFDVLYHRGVADDLMALREIWRVLGHGGRLLIRLPAYEFLYSKHDRAVHTRKRYTEGGLRTLMQQAGFCVERCSYVNSLLFPVAVAQRLAEKYMPALEHQESDLAMPSPLLNHLLCMPMALEAAWLELGLRFPTGLSILCLAHAGKVEWVTPHERNI